MLEQAEGAKFCSGLRGNKQTFITSETQAVALIVLCS